MNGSNQHFTQNEKINELSMALVEAEAKIIHYQLLLSEITVEYNIQQSQLIHDISNPLQIISMSLESILDKRSEPIFETMKKASDKMTSIVSLARQMKLQMSKKTTVI